MAITLYSCPSTRRTIEQAIAANQVILWRVDNLRSLFFNPAISSGSICGAFITPVDNGVGMGANYVVLGGPDGFAYAAKIAGTYTTGNGLSSEVQDWNAASLFLAGTKFYRGSSIQG